MVRIYPSNPYCVWLLLICGINVCGYIHISIYFHSEFIRVSKNQVFGQFPNPWDSAAVVTLRDVLEVSL
jgi:hypothetical protein